jgi:hypothetical protein
MVYMTTPEEIGVPCACRFEKRLDPDFSGIPPRQLDQCGFHEKALERLAMLLLDCYSAASPLKDMALAQRIEAALDPWVRR